jgi:putative ABC transport system permease protein
MSPAPAPRTTTPKHRQLIALLGFLSRFVPDWQRDDWLREWSAEVESARSLRVPMLAIGAIAHVGWLWRRKWQLDSISADAHYAFRTLMRRPAFTVTAIVTLAVGVGATTTLATIISGVLLKPLPFPEPDRLVRVSETREGATGARHASLVHDTLLAWRDHSTTLSSLAGYADAPATIRTEVNQTGDRVRIAGMTPGLFDTLGVRPALGAGPTLAARSADQAVWLSDDAWRRYYRGDIAALGRQLWIDGEPFTIAGVMAPDFAFPDRDTMGWTVMKDVRFLSAIGRLRPGATPAQAADEGTARARTTPDLGQLAIAVFGANGPARVFAVPLLPSLTEDARPSLLLLFVAAGLLLVTGVANVAGLQLAHAVGRRREFAIRSAMGAGSARTVRQLVVENAILGAAGAVAAVMLTIWCHRLLPDWLPAGFPRASEVTLDARALILALGLSLGASQIFGLLPLWFIRHVTLTDALAEDGTSPAGGGLRTRTTRLRSAVLAAQVAVATILLIGAALLGRSLYTLATSDRGYDLSHLLTAQVPMPEHDFTRLQRVAALDAVIARMEQVPGVTHAAATDIFPLVQLEFPRSFTLPPVSANGTPRPVKMASRSVSRNYFATLGMRIAEGRGFTDIDRMDSPASVVVNRAFVRAYLTDRRALGALLPIRFSKEWTGATIVGVVDDVRQQSGLEAPSPQLFACYCQITQGLLADVPVLAIRTTGDPAPLATTLRAVVRDVAPAAGLTSVMTMEARLKERLAVPRLLAAIVIGLGAAALFIAGIGLAGTLAHQVALRFREIGIRAALGATPRAIASGIARGALALTLVGTAIGLVAAFLVARWLDHVVIGVSVHDPIAFAAVPLVLVSVALIASAAPARRAARVDPVKVLRH